MQMLEQAAPEPEAFGAASPAATAGEGTLIAGLGRLTPPPSGGRPRGSAGRPRKSRG
jgi:hypothetical protein